MRVRDILYLIQFLDFVLLLLHLRTSFREKILEVFLGFL